MTTVEELRDAITAEYEDVRAVFQHLRADDLAKRSTVGVLIWRLASEIVRAPIADVRAALRIAAGKRGASLLPRTPITAIAAWRSDRLFTSASRADFLTAWESAFNELFGCVNDLAAEALDGAPLAPARAAALEHLRASVERRRAQIVALCQALGVLESG